MAIEELCILWVQRQRREVSPPVQRIIGSTIKGFFKSQVDRLKKHQVRTTEELDVLLPAVLDRAFRGRL